MLHMVDTNKQKVREGVALSRRLFQFSLDLSRKIPKHSSIDENENNRRAVMKGFLISTSQLSGQIVEAVVRRHLGLAIIGSRALLELNINANYIFDNPKHKSDLVWVNEVCKDIFDRTNSLALLKSKLGGVCLKRRAEEIGRRDLYEINYASLCDYAHLMLRLPLLNNPGLSERLSVGVISQSLCHLVGVIDALIVFGNLTWDKDLYRDVIAFRDCYESSQN